MNILGISCYYHDASASLLKNGVIVAAAEEERFTRKKHDTSFPKNAINYCLKSQKMTMKAIDHVVFYEKPFLKFERVLSQQIDTFPKSFKTFLKSMPSWLNVKLRVMRKIRKDLKFKGDVFFVPHHMTHAASAFFPSPFKKAAIVTIDGVGEWTTTSYGVGENDSIKLLKEIKFPSSLGLLYSTVTAYLGFTVNNAEYKVMGMSPYGKKDRKTNKYYKKLRKVIDVKDDGSYRLDMDYFYFHHADKMPSDKFCELMGSPIRKSKEEVTQKHKDISTALQLVYEDIFFKILDNVYEKTKCKNLVIAGGCGLNSVANGKILKNTKFDKVWIQPNSSDGGTSMGAALYAYTSILKKKRKYRLDHAFLGPEFTAKEIKKFLDENNVKYSTFKNKKDMIKKTAKLIYESNVIGWFQGRMEWGPRALGSRSILANPCNPKMKDILNAKVKHREEFRPFAPVVCEEDALEYFKCDEPIPEPTDFMLMVYPIKKKWHKKIPSVTHVDGSGRLQTIRKHQNASYYELIKEFGKLSGISILINTSFNIRGEPIVCTPYDGYKCMMGTEIDYVVMDKFLIKRNDNPQHMWDGGKTAKN